MSKLNKLPTLQQKNRSLRHSVHDGVAYSVMTGAGETYFAAFALFLKATTAQIGILSALPPLIGSFAQLVSAWLGHVIGNRRKIILTATMLQALSWIPLLLLPLFFPDQSLILLIICVTIYYALGNLVIPQWSSLMGDLVHEQQRGRYFARRNRLMSITNFLAMIGAGVVLHICELQQATYIGYLLVFTLAIIARLISVYFLSRMVDPPDHVATLEIPRGRAWWQRIRGSHFAQFALFFALMNLMVSIASPYFAVYMLRDMQLSYLEFMLITATSVLAQFLTLNSWGRLCDAFGNRLILLVTGCVVPFLPAAWIISQNIAYLLVIQMIAGFFWAGFSLSCSNFLYDLVPAAKRVTYLALHHVLAALGIFIGATLGAQFAEIIEPAVHSDGGLFGWEYALYYVFLASTLGRLLIIVWFFNRIKEVRPTRRLTAGGVVLRATRSPVLAGLVFEYLGSRPRRSKNTSPKN